MAEVEIGVPDGITREDVEKAAQEFREGGPPQGYGPSKLYDVLIDGERYPIKAIIGLAARRVAGRVLSNREFNGGKRDKGFQVLESLGFEIVPKEKGGSLPSQASAAGTGVEEIIPDAETRRRLLEALSQAILAAHEVNPASWALTLPKPGGIFNLNVGKIFVVRIYSDKAELALAKTRLDDLEPTIGGWEKPSPEGDFKSPAEVTWRAASNQDVAEAWEPVSPAVLDAVRLAAAKWSRTNHYDKHRNDAVEYIESELDVELPRPDYGIGDQADLYSSLAKSFLELRDRGDDDGEQVRAHVAEHLESREKWIKALQADSVDRKDLFDLLLDMDFSLGTRGTTASEAVYPQKKADGFLARLKAIAHEPPSTAAELEQAISSLPAGFGLGFLSEFLGFALPDRHWELNSPMREAIKLIGFEGLEQLPHGKRNDFERYFAMRPLVDGLRSALESAGLENPTYLDVGLLLWELARKPANFRGLPDRAGGEKFDFLLENLRAYHPDFTTFGEDDSSWWEHEDSYKRELVTRFNRKLSRALLTRDESEEWSVEVVNNAWAVVTEKLSSDAPQNLLSFWYYQFLQPLRNGGPNCLKFARMFRDLLIGEGPAPERIEVFNERLFPIIEEKYRASEPATSRSFPTFFLMLQDPGNHLFIRTSEFQDVHKWLTGEAPFENNVMGADGYEKSMDFGRTLFETLEGRGLAPRDLVDVQGFLHVVASRNSWIFQAVPNVWDLIRFLNDGHTRVAWSLPQNAKKVEEGDAAYIWIAGENRGVVAYGRLASGALSRKEIPDEVWEVDQQYYVDKDAGPNAKEFALIEIQLVFPHQPVTADELKNDKNLKKLSILKQAAGTVFSVPKNIAGHLYQHLPKGFIVPPRPTPSFDDILASLKTKGLYFPDELVANYLLALQTKRFVILTGISGTGKTQLAMAVAEAFPAWQAKKATQAIDDDALRIVVKPYMKKYRRFVVPARLVELTNWDLSEDSKSMGRVNVNFDGQVVEQSFYRSPTRNVTILLFSGELREWFDAQFSEGDEFLLQLIPQEDAAGGDLKISKPSVSTKKTLAKNSIVVAVRPDWTDHRGLLGYFNPLTGRYVRAPFLELMMAAAYEDERAKTEGDEPAPFFLVLDEMNLARVEHYFSDLLSCMESGKPIHLHDDEAAALGETEDCIAIPMDIEIPPNLFVIGTVNVDETTYMFSPKVLDRAFTIELNDVDLRGYAGEGPVTQADPKTLGISRFDGLAGRWAKPDEGHWQKLGDLEGGKYQRWLIRLNEDLESESRHFGYRVANEIARFVTLAAEQTDGNAASTQNAFDIAVLEKVLPKMNGTQQELDGPIRNLFAFAIRPDGSWEAQAPTDLKMSGSGFVSKAKEAPPEQDVESEGSPKEPKPIDPYLPRTARKLWRMAKRMKQRGFVSYIE